MKELYRHNSIKRPSHIKRKQRRNVIFSLPCSMNLPNKHIQCSVSRSPKAGSHVLLRQQAMLLMDGSYPASHDSFLDLPKSVEERNRLPSSRDRVVSFAWLQ
jgi:hypothetical protein